jgi:Smg protein
MIDVLMYLYETYWRPDACPEPEQLSRKLSAVGFERDEIDDALSWLRGLAAANTTAPAQAGSGTGVRVYTPAEEVALGVEGINLLTSLQVQGKISSHVRELIIERALSSGQQPMDADDLRVMLLIVFWCLDQEPDPLLLDDLYDDPDSPRTYH